MKTIFFGDQLFKSDLPILKICRLLVCHSLLTPNVK